MDSEAEESQPSECLLPPVTPNPASILDNPSLLKFGGKRTRDSDVPFSSDPPLFSSDDLPASSENYVYTRKKRRYPRTWWGAKACSSNDQVVEVSRRKRDFKRAVDSGVWMGSEDTDMSADDGSELRLLAKIPGWAQPKDVDDGARPKEIQRTGIKDAMVEGMTEQGIRSTEDNPISPEQHAAHIVQHCLDESIEIVDLSSLQLETLSPAIVRPLGYLTKRPEIDHHPPSQDAYGPLTPSLHLYLSCNALRVLPSDIFKLKYLTVISLRNNKLTELPPAIGDLENLIELNVGINRLKWLPWEILKLLGGRLRTLNIYPNPLFEIPRSPVDAARDIAAPEVLESSIHHQLWKPARQACTAVTFMNVDGSHSRGTPPAPSSAVDSSCLVSFPNGNHNRANVGGTLVSRVPSLLELALRSCSQSPYLPQLPSLLPPDSPKSMCRLLAEAYSIKEAGGRMCSVCGKGYLVARTEWLEWWDWFSAYDDICSPSQRVNVRNAMPLLRRGCSWQCVPTGLSTHGF